MQDAGALAGAQNKQPAPLEGIQEAEKHGMALPADPHTLLQVSLYAHHVHMDLCCHTEAVV